jgi:hypothetical protein
MQVQISSKFEINKPSQKLGSKIINLQQKKPDPKAQIIQNIMMQ